MRHHYCDFCSEFNNVIRYSMCIFCGIFCMSCTAKRRTKIAFQLTDSGG